MLSAPMVPCLWMYRRKKVSVKQGSPQKKQWKPLRIWNNSQWLYMSIQTEVLSGQRDGRKQGFLRNISEGNVKDLGEFLRTSGVRVMKMGAHVLKDGLAQELLEKGSPIPGIVFLRTGDGIIELNSIHASKGNALCTLCKKLGISMENVLAIGDNENDISMLQAAGISAAMENAEDDVKQAAKFVAGHNEEDGAAHFLEEWVL